MLSRGNRLIAKRMHSYDYVELKNVQHVEKTVGKGQTKCCAVHASNKNHAIELQKYVAGVEINRITDLDDVNTLFSLTYRYRTIIFLSCRADLDTDTFMGISGTQI